MIVALAAAAVVAVIVLVVIDPRSRPPLVVTITVDFEPYRQALEAAGLSAARLESATHPRRINIQHAEVDTP